MSNFLVKTLGILKNSIASQLSNQESDFLQTKKQQLASGIYCPLNFEDNNQEIEFLEKNLEKITKEPKKGDNNENLSCFLVKIGLKEGSKALSGLLQSLSQFKIKIVDILVSKKEDFMGQIYNYLELFNENFPQGSLNAYWQNNSGGLASVLLVNCSDVLSMNELLGNYIFDVSGRILQVFQGKLGIINQEHLILYTEKREKERELNMKENLVGNGFIFIPKDEILSSYLNRVNIVGEIVSADNFEADEIFIKYELVSPPFWKFEFDSVISYSEQEGIDELNRSESITQTASSCLQKNEDGTQALFYHFCFPFDWQLAVEESQMSLFRWPIIYFQVNSSDSWGRNRVESYGFCEIPKVAGFHEIKVRTWRPKETVDEQINSFFLGGSIKLKDFKKIAVSYYRTDQNLETFINRFPVDTESSGNVNIRLNVSIQSNEYKRFSIEKILKYADDRKIEEKFMQKMEEARRDNMEIPKLLQTDVGLQSRYSKI